MNYLIVGMVGFVAGAVCLELFAKRLEAAIIRAMTIPSLPPPRSATKATTPSEPL
jgi:hypothetical protein